MRRGIVPGKNAVTSVPWRGVNGFIDQKRRRVSGAPPAMGLFGVGHPGAVPVMPCLGPVARAPFDLRDAGWDRRHRGRPVPGAEVRRDVIRGAHGVPEGMPPSMADQVVDKVPARRPPVRAGGGRALRHHRRLARPVGSRRMPAVTYEIR